MKWILFAIGVILALVGILWFLQGINVVGGSFMTGQALYAVLGAGLFIIGGGLIILANRRPRDRMM